MSRQVFPPAHTRVLPARLPMCVPLGVSDLSAFARAYCLAVYALVRARSFAIVVVVVVVARSVWAHVLLLVATRAGRRGRRCAGARLRPTEGTRATGLMNPTGFTVVDPSVLHSAESIGHRRRYTNFLETIRENGVHVPTDYKRVFYRIDDSHSSRALLYSDKRRQTFNRGFFPRRTRAPVYFAIENHIQIRPVNPQSAREITPCGYNMFLLKRCRLP